MPAASVPNPRHAGFAIGAGLAAFALAAFAPAILNDGDTYWHIRAGEWMLAHHAVLHADPFSYTALGAPWHSAEWLSEILMALAFRADGWSGIHLLFAAAAFAALGEVRGKRRGGGLSAGDAGEPAENGGGPAAGRQAGRPAP